MLALVGGCSLTSAPRPELQAYASAYEQVRTGGHLLLDEISPFVTASTQAGEGDVESTENCGLAADGYPSCFDPNLALREAGIRANEDPSVLARRAALDVVMEYNTILLALAEGRSSEALTQRFGELQTLVTTAAGVAGLPTAGISMLAPAALGLLQDLSARFEAARAAGTIRESILASKEDIRALHALLIEDTKDIYAIYVAGQEIELVRLNAARNRARLAGQAEIQADMEGQMQALQQRIRDYHASVGAYTRVLAASSGALDTLARAAEAPGSSIDEITAVVRQTGEIKAKAESFFNLIRAVRAAPA